MRTLTVIALTVFSLFHGKTLFAQQTIHFEDNGVVISSALADCSDPANGTSNMYLLLTIRNANDRDVQVTFTKRMWYGERCIGCKESNPEQEVTVNLSAGAASSGTCGDRKSRLLVFHSMKDNPAVQGLSSFSTENVAVVELNAQKQMR